MTTLYEVVEIVLFAVNTTSPPPPPSSFVTEPPPPPPTTSTSTSANVESVTSNVPVDAKVWMVYSPDVVTVPPVPLEEEHEPLGDAGDGDAVLGSLNTWTRPASVLPTSAESAPMATYSPSPESDKDVGA